MLNSKLPIAGKGSNPLLVLGVMSGVAAVLFSAFLLTWLKSQPAKPKNSNSAVESQELFMPPLDRAALEAGVDDSSAAARAQLERPALDSLAEAARLYTPAHFEKLGAPELNPALLESLQAAPGDFRGQPFTAHGWISSLRSRRTSLDGPEEHQARVELEQGGTVWVVALSLPTEQPLVLDDFVRVDGLFLKLYREEGGLAWYEGPLLVAPEIRHSMPRLDPAPERLGASTLQEITDDQARDGVGELPYPAYWECMQWVAANASRGGLKDWSAVPRLDQNALEALAKAPESLRMQPFRIEAYVMAISVQKLAENPARMSELTEGWLGSQQWKNNDLLHFKSPFALRQVPQDSEVEVHGWFFKRWAYESAGMGVVEAPVFLVEGIEVRKIAPEKGLTILSQIIVVVVLGLLAVFVYLTRRDRLAGDALNAQRKQRRERQRLKPSAGSTS